MYPKTFCGWYNRLIRGHPYNEKTATILDNNFKPSPRLLSILTDRNPKSDTPNSLNENGNINA